MATQSKAVSHAEGFANVVGKTIVIISYGSRGDIQPFVALGARLMDAGAKILLLTNSDHEAFVTSFGIGFAGTAGSCRDDHRRPEFVDGIATGNFGPFWSWQMKEKKRSAPAIMDSERSAVEGIDVDLIYATPLTYHNACSMSERLKVPMILGTLFPTTNPFSSVGWRPFRPPAHPTLVHWTPALTTPQFWQHGSHKVTGFLVVNDQPSSGTEPADEVFGGAAERRRVEDFLASGDPPVYMGWGSMVVPRWTTPLAVRALMLAGQRGIILAGWAGLSADDLQGEEDSASLERYAAENVIFVQSVPHEWLLPQCSVTVHHGGAGTVAAALRSGVPTVITPCGLDQPDNARIVEQSGCGLAMPQFAHLSADALGSALVSCVADDMMKDTCARMAVRLRAEDGLGNAVAEIDKHLRPKASEDADARGGHRPPPVFSAIARFMAKHTAA